MACFDMRGGGMLPPVSGGSYHRCFIKVHVLILILVLLFAGCKPVAVITADRDSGDAPLVVNFDASKSTDKGKDIREYEWDFDNDGNVDASGVRVEHTFNNPGEYTVKLVVRDAKDKTSQAVKTITVKEVILRAGITADTSACISSPVAFDASESFDKDDDIISYEWDFDNDGVVDATGVNASHGFPGEKIYNVRLVVHDAKGNTSQAFHDIRIYGSPSIEISADEEKIVYPFMTTLRWHAKNITNLSITDNNTGRRVYEGTASDDFVNLNPYRTTTYTITATGPCGDISKNITIYVYPSHNHAVINASVNSGCFPLSVDFDASLSTDINNDISGYEWDFDGDGTYDASGINSSHIFSTRGEYRVGLRITDPLNHTSETTLIIRAYGKPSADIKSDSLIGPDGNVILTWMTTDATSVTLDDNPVSLNGTITMPQTGTKTYSLKATGPCGTATDTITIMPDMPISVTIETPHSSQSINSPEVLVKGTVNNPLGGETMVVVNGTPAFLYENQYIASGVSLTPGNNTITVEAIGEYGNKGQASLTVYSTSSEKLISISGSDMTGVSPMETTIVIKVPQGFIPVLSGIHPQDGNIEVLEQTPDNQYHIKLTGEGIYTFTARTTDADNNEYSDSISIIVQDKEDIDSKLKAMWSEMKTNLANGNIDGALKNFCISSAEKYRDIFTILNNKLPDIALNMPDLELIDISGRFATYRIKRDEIINGQQERITYYVTFFRDEYGNWSLVSF